MNTAGIKIIAFYLPQYHPTPNNDKWWGKGFTEWTNVGKAKPLFRGHKQPKVPADLGYYDLRLPEVREAQAQLAKEAGIDGFCYYHYWFKKGHEELDFPFKEVVRLGKPKFPFCLCWANESWHKKFWNIDGTYSKELLAEQMNESDADHEAHFYSLLDAFKDERYIRVNNKLLFVIYKPLEFHEINNFMKQWNNLAYVNGLNGFHFVGYTGLPQNTVSRILNLGMDAVIVSRLLDSLSYKYNTKSIRGILNHVSRRILKRPFTMDYKNAIKFLSNNEDSRNEIYPTIIPNWDHTPRSKSGGYVLKNSTPELFGKHVKTVLENVKYKDGKHKIIFLKAWNEWGEGNYMEPDLTNGKAYIEELSKQLKDNDF